ncbi:MAG: hypothetical protein J6M60_01255 [Clostridia bacterium]|nr:hypothetical protein [Clostridia bacterium]
MEKKKGISIKITTIALSVLLIAAAFLAGTKIVQVNVLRKELESEKYKKDTNLNVSDVEKPYESTYSFNITDLKDNETRDYKIDDDYTITFKVKENATKPEGKYPDVYYGVYVNDNLITMDNLLSDFNIDVTLWNGYLLYSFQGVTDIRSDMTYVIGKDGMVVKMIYDLDENDKGLVQTEIQRYADKLVVTATRKSHGGAIVSHGNAMDGITAKSLKTIPKDTVVEARYTYKINENGIIDFVNPEITVLETFKQYVKQEKDYIISQIKSDPEYEEGMVEKFISEN